MVSIRVDKHLPPFIDLFEKGKSLRNITIPLEGMLLEKAYCDTPCNSATAPNNGSTAHTLKKNNIKIFLMNNTCNQNITNRAIPMRMANVKRETMTVFFGEKAIDS